MDKRNTLAEAIREVLAEMKNLMQAADEEEEKLSRTSAGCDDEGEPYQKACTVMSSAMVG